MMRNRLLLFLVFLLTGLLFLTACSNDNQASSEKKEEKDKYDLLAEEKNAELELIPIEMSSYGEEIGATFKAPKYKEFAVNGKVVVEGTIDDYSQLKEDQLGSRSHQQKKDLQEISMNIILQLKMGSLGRIYTFSMEKGNIRFRCRYLVKTVKIIFMTQLILKLIM